MRQAIRTQLENTLGARVTSARPVSGGDINEAFAVSLSDGRQLFIKTRADAPRDTYRREADGLSFLRQAEAIGVAEVVAVDDAFLALSWIDSAAGAHDFDEQLGRGLAALHRAHPDEFGLDHGNYVGSLPQPNDPCATLSEFYRERRLRPLVERAAARDLLEGRLVGEFERLYTRLDTLIGPEEPAARLHGDLWSGNVMVDRSGGPVLIDPAVYGGHREIDLAMLQLFGAPSPRLFAAYDEVYPRAPNSAERVRLWQLYPLLVHVCLFGASYVAPLSRALRSYL